MSQGAGDPDRRKDFGKGRGVPRVANDQREIDGQQEPCGSLAP